MFDLPEISRVVLAGALLLTAIGCREPATEGNSLPSDDPRPAIGGHEHRVGARGGLIVPIDGAHYHVEAILAEGDMLRFFTLGEREDRVQEVEAQALTAYVRPRDDLNSRPIALRPEPQPGDPPGTTSAFVGRLPDGLSGRALVVVVPSIRIAGRRLRFGFEMDPASASAMPEKVADEEERELYLTPGGRYTEADIAANGHSTASVKFAGFRAAHDPHPSLGERICPITDTLANPSCSWIVGGKTYTFCCPPCVDEFVRQAKEAPESLLEPEDYVAPREGTP